MQEEENNNKKRLFIAIKIPEESRKYFYDVITAISKKNDKIRAIIPDNIHLTLKFLGYTDINKIPKIIRAVSSVSVDFPEFCFDTGGRAEAFPALKSARIIFIPIEEGNEKIIQFYDKLEDGLSRIKIRKEPRKFIPHLTVARIKDMIDLRKDLDDIDIKPQKNIHCINLTLFESVLKRNGPEYKVVEEFRLKC